jgi:metallophosphoesterase superfamily enzyme
MAQAEGEAEKIKQQIEAMKSADERFLVVLLTQILPELFKNLSPDKIFIMGDRNETFSSLSKAIFPFLQLLPEYSDQIKKLFGNGNMKELQKVLIE